MNDYRLVKHGSSEGAQCTKCGGITYNQRHISERFCPSCSRYWVGPPGPPAGPDELVKEGGTKT